MDAACIDFDIDCALLDCWSIVLKLAEAEMRHKLLCRSA